VSTRTKGRVTPEKRFGEMLNTVKAIVKEGRIELMEQVHIPEGAEVLVTILSDDAEFWLRASEPSLASVWGNEQDDIYEQLLER
jgi:hypothetical protein